MASIRSQIITSCVVAFASMFAGFFLVYLLVGTGGGEAEQVGVNTTRKIVKEDKKQKNSATAGSNISASDSSKKLDQVTAKPKDSGKEVVEKQRSVQPLINATSHKHFCRITDFFIFRCWSEGSDNPVEGKDCGELSQVKSVIEENMDEIEKCLKDYSSVKESAKMTLALKVDFSKNRYRTWLGTSSTIEAVEEVSACIRRHFAGVAFKDMPHSYSRYVVYFEIDVAGED